MNLGFPMSVGGMHSGLVQKDPTARRLELSFISFRAMASQSIGGLMVCSYMRWLLDVRPSMMKT